MNKYKRLITYGFIQKLLNNEMILNKSVTGDPGVEWNKYPQGIRGTDQTNKFYFFGNNHKQVPPYFDGWMYNDLKGDVIFEITPFYPWHNETKKNHPDFITYKQFVKNYKPVLITTISKKKLKQWLGQAKELEKKYFSEFD